MHARSKERCACLTGLVSLIASRECVDDQRGKDVDEAASFSTSGSKSDTSDQVRLLNCAYTTPNPESQDGDNSAADPGLSVRGSVLSRGYKRGWVPPPAPARVYGGVL